MPEIETIETPFRGRQFAVDVLRVRTDAGHEVRREVVRHPGAVTIVPVLAGPDGTPPRIVLIRNFRAAVDATLWELPAGGLKPDETPPAAAARELEEETGYRAGRLRAVGTFHTTPGFSDELMHVFAAGALSPVGQRLEPGEQIEVVPRTFEEIDRLVDAGEIIDGKTLAALLLYRRSGDHHAREDRRP